ncbi:S-adenosyl-L-methionine-dependent methyltransferase [Syncephalis plumigaleata]|nr:S-adenosyl-L-methionine-dependent methyltransferase [Syncephalis plumigaleata]
MLLREHKEREGEERGRTNKQCSMTVILQQQHYLFLLQFGSNHFAPVENPSAALDVGCGTGIWMMEMATQFPDCEFTGIDQVSAQPDDVLPPNCRFVPCDQLAGYLPFTDSCFDYVHQRMLVGSVPTDKWGSVCDDIYRVTRPRGWFEIVDTDGLIHGRCAYRPDDIDMNGLGLCVDSCSEETDAGEYAATLGPAAERINRWLLAAMERRDVHPEEVFELEPLLHDSGFSQIESRRMLIPMGAWGKQAGQMCLESLRGLVYGLKQFLIDEEITDELTFKETLNDWQLEADRGRYHIEVVIYWGQRLS